MDVYVVITNADYSRRPASATVELRKEIYDKLPNNVTNKSADHEYYKEHYSSYADAIRTCTQLSSAFDSGGTIMTKIGW